MRASEAFRCFSHAAISPIRRLGSSIRPSRHWPRSTPISIATMLSQLACLGCSGTPGVPESAGLRRARKCFIERAGRVGRQIVLHGPDACGFEIMDIDEFAHALGVVLGCPPLGDLDLAPRPVHVDADE